MRGSLVPNQFTDQFHGSWIAAADQWSSARHCSWFAVHWSINRWMNRWLGSSIDLSVRWALFGMKTMLLNVMLWGLAHGESRLSQIFKVNCEEIHTIPSADVSAADHGDCWLNTMTVLVSWCWQGRTIIEAGRSVSCYLLNDLNVHEINLFDSLSSAMRFRLL